jgi:crotonobetainyl-CoA:carnitine CoA-transferase CaiB-like acyl-CoA transferase
VPLADLAAGALTALGRILAALLHRERTGEGSRLVVSMTHEAHRLVAHRLGEEVPRLLTGGLACYRVYATADGRLLTVGALETRFFVRLCELLGRPELAGRQYDPDGQEALAEELAAIFAQRPLADWLELCDGEDVCVGPVATREEAALQLGEPAAGRAPALGEHTEAWRRELGVAAG